MRLYVIDTGRLRIDKGAIFTPGIDDGVHIEIPVPVYLIQTDGDENVLVDTGLHPANLADPYHAWGRLPTSFYRCCSRRICSSTDSPR